MEKLLEMEGVSLSFDKKPALADLSFQVKRGEVFGFLGPSGAGKTTTIKLLTRQLRADAGFIQVFGEDIGALSQSAFDRIGVLTDNSGLYERLSVFENLKVFADLKGIPSSAIYAVLERVGLKDDSKKSCKTLSKGMKQRLILARAVLHKPELLFLDEPTAALDPATTQEIHRLLRDLNREGTTIFLTTHNMEEADKLCHWVAFLHHGHIVEGGPPQELKLKYAKEQIVARTAEGRTITVEKSATGLSDLLTQLGQEKLLTLHSSEPNLEEIFLHLTGRELS